MRNMTARFFRAAVLMVILFFTRNLYAHSGKDSSVLQKIAEECTGKLKQRMQANATLRSTGRAKQQNFVVTVGFDEPPIDYDRHGYILEKNLTGVTPNYYSSADLSMLQANINPKLVALYQQEQVEAYYLIVNYFNLYISRKAILDYSDANGNYNINAGLFNSSGGIFNSDIWNTFSNLEQLSNDFRSVTDEIAGSIFTATNRTMLLSVGKFCGKDLTMVDNSTFSIGCEYLANVAMNTKNNALMTEAAYSRIPAVLRSYLENNTSGASPVSLTNGHVDGMVQSVKQSKNVAKILSLQTYALLKPVLTNFSTAEYSALSVEERIHILKAIVTGSAAQVKDNMDNGGESTTMKIMRTVPKREAVVTDFFDRLYSTGVLVSLYNNLTDASYMGLVGENNFSGFVNELSRLFTVKYNLLDSKKYEDLAKTIGEDHTLYYGTYMENGNPSSSFITDYEEGAFTSIDMLPNGDIKVNDNSYIRSKFSNPAAYSPADEILPLEARNHVYKPFEPILCVLYSKPSYGGFDDKVIGKPFILPAIAFKWMKEKAWTYAIHASMVDVIKLTVNGAFVGSIGGATGWRLYADVAIVAKTFADDVMRIPQINNAIRALPGGDEFLWYYQKCSMIADFAYISPYAFKFFKGFARSTYNLSKRGYQTITAFTENGWVKLKDYYAKVRETLAKNGIVVEELSNSASLLDIIYNTQKAVVTQWKNIISTATNIRKGNFGEMASDMTLTEKGYEALHTRLQTIDEPTRQGIDGVFKKGNEYFIVEAKYKGTATLSMTADGKQMSDTWINGSNRLRNAVGGNQAIYDDIINSGYRRLLAEVAPDGTIIYKELDGSGNILNEFNP